MSYKRVGCISTPTGIANSIQWTHVRVILKSYLYCIMYYPTTNLIVNYPNVYPPVGKTLSVHWDFKPQISLSEEYILRRGNIPPEVIYCPLLSALTEKKKHGSILDTYGSYDSFDCLWICGERWESHEVVDTAEKWTTGDKERYCRNAYSRAHHGIASPRQWSVNSTSLR